MRLFNYKKLIGFFILAFFLIPLISLADKKEIQDLTDQIEQKKQELERLDKEIAEQRKLLNETSGQATNLQSKINSLEASRKKIVKEISATETQIKKAELTINKLDLEITDKQKLVDYHSLGIGQSIRKINTLENKSLVERFLSSENFSDFWTDLEQSLTIQKAFQNEIAYLLSISAELRETKAQKDVEKAQLAQYKKELSGQAEAVNQTKSEQQNILALTKNKEAEYQRLLKEKEAEKRAFEEEVFDIESKIKILIDPKSFSSAQKGIFSWPLDNVRITQYFGRTEFSERNRGIYNGQGHQGVDFGTPIGTKIKAIGSGKVKGFGNTDAFPNCRSWGKWVLIEHDNGISSLYAHLSSVLVNQGDVVSKGDVIALSGNTGVSTGPHLHLTLYITQGVKISRYSDYRPGGTGCFATNATVPFADLSAYLNPMSYLPSL